MSRLLSLFSSGLVITDGAWGTEFQKRGLAIGEPADVWNLTRPADVEAVARSYVEAGSRVILTNTFRGNPVALSAHGQGDRAVAINRRGAELSKQQSAAGVRVFASLGPTGKVMATGEIDEQRVTDGFRIQAEALAAGGADVLLFETFSDVEEARLAVQAAKPTGLPIIVSFAFDSGRNKDRTMMGVTPETAARAMVEEGVDAIGTTAVRVPSRLPRSAAGSRTRPVCPSGSSRTQECPRSRPARQSTP